MYIIIAGAGTVGFHIASLLAQEKHEVTIIEQSEEVIENVRRQLDIRTIVGNAASPSIMREAETKRADLIIAVTDSDETNIITCFIAKGLGAQMTIARVRHLEYSGYFIGAASSPSAPRKVIRPKSFGVDLFINPAIEAAREITNILSGFYSTPIANLASGLIQIREFRTEKETTIDQPIAKIAFPKPCVVVALLRSEGIIIPRADEIIKPDDRVYLLARRESMDELGTLFAKPHRPAKSVVILGGGCVGSLVAEELKGRRLRVKIIEKNLRRCQEIAAKLPGATVVQGDGTDRDFLIEQGVPTADAFVAATESDELNILSGLLAKNLGVSRNLALVNRPANIPLAETVGIDVAASAPLLAAHRIAHFALHGGAISVALLGGEQIQAIEFVTSPTASIVRQKLTEVGLPQEVLAGAITHESTITIPPDDSLIQAGDHIIIISPLSAIPAVEKLFM
ncbi:MAG: Trk system potassium transporter TrkA [Dehalococcoidales bacterium]|nr:Trk system potassium transporter TrkA [Dehalococcoidales bacterium]